MSVLIATLPAAAVSQSSRISADQLSWDPRSVLWREPGAVVRDRNGRDWVMKSGREAKAEIIAAYLPINWAAVDYVDQTLRTVR